MGTRGRQCEFKDETWAPGLKVEAASLLSGCEMDVRKLSIFGMESERWVGSFISIEDKDVISSCSSE